MYVGVGLVKYLILKSHAPHDLEVTRSHDLSVCVRTGPLVAGWPGESSRESSDTHRSSHTTHSHTNEITD
jgi:hypothetical protein